MRRLEKLVASKHVTTRQEQNEPESAGLGCDQAPREEASPPYTKEID